MKAARCPRCHAELQVESHLASLFRCLTRHDGRVAYFRLVGGALVRADGYADRAMRSAVRKRR